MENSNNEKTYSQAQVDDIANSVRNTEQNKYKELESKFNALQEQNMKLNENYDKMLNAQESMLKDIHKQQFINHGGNPSAFDDFYSLNKDNFNNINWDETSKMKNHFFNNVNAINDVDTSFFEIKQTDLHIDAEKARAEFVAEKNKQIYKG